MSVRESTLHPVQAYSNAINSPLRTWRGRAIAAAKGGLAGLKKAASFTVAASIRSGLAAWTTGGSALRTALGASLATASAAAGAGAVSTLTSSRQYSFTNLEMQRLAIGLLTAVGVYSGAALMGELGAAVETGGLSLAYDATLIAALQVLLSFDGRIAQAAAAAIPALGFLGSLALRPSVEILGALGAVTAAVIGELPLEAAGVLAAAAAIPGMGIKDTSLLQMFGSFTLGFFSVFDIRKAWGIGEIEGATLGEECEARAEPAVEFGKALVRRYLASLPREDRAQEIKNLTDSDPGLQIRLTQFLVAQLMESPVALTKENTPFFVHDELEQISRLREVPQENRDREIRMIAGRLLTTPRAARDLYTILNLS